MFTTVKIYIFSASNVDAVHCGETDLKCLHKIGFNGPFKKCQLQESRKIIFLFKKNKKRFSGQFRIFWNTVSAISSKPFELKTWNFYTKQTSMGPSKNVNYSLLFLQRFSDNFPKFIENEGGPLKSVEKEPCD